MSEQVEDKSIQNGDKGKVVMIYVGVAIISAIIIACFMFLGKYSRGVAENNTSEDSRKAINIQVLSMEDSIGLNDILKLEQDFTATNQDGDAVTLQSLKGKVWVFAQFYGSCPECNKVNLEILTDVYKKYEKDPNFQIVTVSIMEEDDGVKSMKNMAEARNAETGKWWFLTADVDSVNKFCTENMMYAKFIENTNKEGDGMQGAIFHDMGMAVFNSDMIMKAKVDVFSPLEAGNILGSELEIKQLDLEIAAALKTLKENNSNE
ncbi:MAG: cytochrome oxidase Cu insertion factor (SCO1/SenC/PrrC family) [Rubritalea sp.]|jgi:cytochrome oxidase Cu insertion factor (SCO1/SenC/PrrC family)